MKKVITIFAALSCGLASMAQNETEFKVQDEYSNKEHVIAWPTSMTIKADSLLLNWNAQHYLYSDKECEQTKDSPAYSEEDVKERLRRLPTVIEMHYNDIVKECIDKYATQLRQQVSIMLGAGNFYIPIIEETLDRFGLPLELKYLPVVESGLNPRARNSSGATGLWQITLSTAQRYGMEINSMVDDRYDVEKSTIAAANYLKDLYHIYGDWNLVIAAYNCGPANVNKAIHSASGKTDYWSIYPYLPKETRGIIPAFIAANYIMNYYCEHNISPMKAKYPTKTDTVVVSKNLHMKQIETLCKINEADIQALNPQYRTEVIPGVSKPRVLRLPSDKIQTFVDLQDSIYKTKDPLTKRAVTVVDTKKVAKAKTEHSARYVRVRRGDTLGAIARRNHTTVKNIKRLNGMRSDRLSIGKRLRVK